MFSKSPKVGSPAEGEMSIPRAKGASEAVTVTDGVRASDAGCVAAPDTEQHSNCNAAQMSSERLQATAFVVGSRNSAHRFLILTISAGDMPRLNLRLTRRRRIRARPSPGAQSIALRECKPLIARSDALRSHCASAPGVSVPGCPRANGKSA